MTPIYKGAICCVLLMMAGGGFGQEPTPQTVIATIGDESITLAQILEAKRILPEQFQSLEDEVLYDALVNRLIQQSLLSQGLQNPPSWTKAALENHRLELLSSIEIERINAQAVSEQAITRSYELKYANAQGTEEVNAAHILVETQEEADALIEQLNAGADFSTLAQEHSIGPSGVNGGDLGWFGKGQMVAPFEEAAFALDVGAISDPVETQFGWHILLLKDKRQSAPPTLDEVRAEIVTELSNAAVVAEIERLSNEIEIARQDDGIDPSVLSSMTAN